MPIGVGAGSIVGGAVLMTKGGINFVGAFSNSSKDTNKEVNANDEFVNVEASVIELVENKGIKTQPETS